MNIDKLLQGIVADKADTIETIWKPDSTYIRVLDLPIDTRGEIGEALIAEALRIGGYAVVTNNETDPTKKHWDIMISNQYTFEVKTATLGKDGKMFQHENIEKDRDYTGIILLDIAPDAVYLTVAPKATLPFDRNNHWSINPKKMHRRRHGIQYKWDLSLKDVEQRKVETVADIIAHFQPIMGEMGEMP